ncbi:MAG: hypothetical protein CBD18_08260 [Opitutales bacterium TMED158]|nr:MAG: hypothetical protein CBD18_08260 [Opitutales bacterium TMED158]
MAIPLSKAKLSALRKLQSKKHREAEGRFLIEGWHLLDEALKADVALRAAIFEDGRELSDADRCVRKAVEARAEEAYVAQESQLKALSETRTSPGAIGVVDRRPSDLESIVENLPNEGPCLLVALDGVSDPGNCGSIVRACDWFGADAVLLGEGCSELENGKLVRATMGGIFHMPIGRAESLARELERFQRNGFQVIASNLGESVSLEGYEWPSRAVLAIGNEARGVSKEVLDLSNVRLRIPSFGEGESLNAAMAASVMLGHWRVG